MPEHADDVARYYDENTAAFLARGEGGSEGVLHRAVWGQGVVDRAGALHFVHELILREIDTLGSPRPRILDLGCGVGGSLLYLLERRDAEGFGITISGEQYERARRHGNGRWLRGDFCRDPLPAEVDLAYGIESFVHGSDARAFFGNVSRALRPRGRLVLVDDFLAIDARDQMPVRDFIRGWHATSLLRPHEVDVMAMATGLALLSERDLTPHLSLDRPRDRALAVLLPLIHLFLSDSPRARSLVGGNALRKSLKQGFIEYRFRVWERSIGPTVSA
jgi:tocopherol O-methyltransferase